MFTVIGIMFAGIGIGYLLRQQSLPWINKAITALIWLLQTALQPMAVQVMQP